MIRKYFGLKAKHNWYSLLSLYVLLLLLLGSFLFLFFKLSYIHELPIIRVFTVVSFSCHVGTRKCQMEGKRVLVELGTLLLSCMPLFDPPRHESA
ncbi:Os12g0254700 [Oryza sativa Japonica Group]|jgi:hypothetical protein|uniref:Os12g0254700 protein n=1 Tax=Oryza sativa subsp. japonica TaxID=39947 RepID=A0A0P0Y8X4_ORYSJ|nr:hypothetical protein EE612_058684 [Oryza sativa]BAT16551.1 Os12g0254700 [Oryza sativa Japonica Group]